MAWARGEETSSASRSRGDEALTTRGMADDGQLNETCFRSGEFECCADIGVQKNTSRDYDTPAAWTLNTADSAEPNMLHLWV
ncbi:hypothetical protein SVAN01_08578 [Stagonosporopsis vannaccii]|nr:hypothetical protein SVAN01_08578 [Stagonosporopsis vannaccii]